MTAIQQYLSLVIRPADVASLNWSVPYWRDLADHSSEANRGIRRHGGVPKAESFVPSHMKPAYPKHIREYLSSQGDPAGDQPRSLIAFGTRNTFQNIGLPGWHADRSPQLLCQRDEPISHWKYHGFCHFADGSSDICSVRFQRDGSVVLDGKSRAKEDIQFIVTGQILQEADSVPPLSLTAAMTYDQRHVFHLLWEDWQAKFDDHALHKAVHDELMAAFMENLSESVEVRAAALAAIANQHGLAITDKYLHSSLGVREDGSLVLIIANGSLTEIGRLQQAMGSKASVLLDNGGSVGIAYYSRGWKRGAWSSDEDLPTPAFVGQGSYFRPQGHAIMIVELTQDIEERPFVPGPHGSEFWK